MKFSKNAAATSFSDKILIGKNTKESFLCRIYFILMHFILLTQYRLFFLRSIAQFYVKLWLIWKSLQRSHMSDTCAICPQILTQVSIKFHDMTSLDSTPTLAKKSRQQPMVWGVEKNFWWRLFLGFFQFVTVSAELWKKAALYIWKMLPSTATLLTGLAEQMGTVGKYLHTGSPRLVPIH